MGYQNTCPNCKLFQLALCKLRGLPVYIFILIPKKGREKVKFRKTIGLPNNIPPSRNYVQIWAKWYDIIRFLINYRYYANDKLASPWWIFMLSLSRCYTAVGHTKQVTTHRLWRYTGLSSRPFLYSPTRNSTQSMILFAKDVTSTQGLSIRAEIRTRHYRHRDIIKLQLGSFMGSNDNLGDSTIYPKIYLYSCNC